MGYAAGKFSARSGHQLQLNTALSSQSVAGNYSVVNWSLHAVKTSSSSSYRLNNDSTWSVNINGNTASGLWSYDFRNTTSYLLGSGSYTIPHNSDGSKTYGFSASANGNSPLGTASASGSEALPTIARASNSTFSPSPMVAGSAATISTHRASTGFTHTITYSFGGQSGTIGTGVGDSVGWTPPLGLLTEIPNSVSGTGTITTVTYSGGTNVGSTAVNFTLNAPDYVIPTIGSVTASEAVSAVASSVGSLVQAISKLNLAIVSAAGAYGSTITANRIVVDGQTVNAASGTSGVLASSGTLTITAIVTDSRGRTGTATASINVLAYAPPTIDATTLSVKRSFVDGTLNDDGTYIKALFTAGAKSLVNGNEKNTLTYKILTRKHGDTVWNLIKTVTPGGVTFTGSQVIGGYDISHSWDVLIQAVDLFATTSLVSNVATAAIFMHWDASLGMGIGKYRENGMLDVAGDIYSGTKKLAGYLLAQNAVIPSTVSSALPYGTSTVMVNPDAGWPVNGYYGTLVSTRVWNDGGSIQYWSAYQPGVDLIFYRQWFYNATSWSAWATVTSPAGQITQYAGASAPPGHLLCQGQAISRTTYARLFGVCSTTYGAGDGSSTFNLPNMSGRVPVGYDSSQGEFNALGKLGGAKTHVLVAGEQAKTLYSNPVLVPTNNIDGGGSGGFGANNRAYLATGGPPYTNLDNAPGGGAHNNLQPYIALNYIIKI